MNFIKGPFRFNVHNVISIQLAALDHYTYTVLAAKQHFKMYLWITFCIYLFNCFEKCLNVFNMKNVLEWFEKQNVRNEK